MCVFIGFCEKTKGYKLFDPITGKVKVSQNESFFKDLPWDWSRSQPTTPEIVTINISTGNPFSELNQNPSQTSTSSAATEVSSPPANQNTIVRYRSISDIYMITARLLSQWWIPQPLRRLERALSGRLRCARR